MRDGYEIKLEHVRDPRAAFYVATIHRLENDVHRFWGVVGDSKEQTLVAATAFIEERLSLHAEQPAAQASKDDRTQVA